MRQWIRSHLTYANVVATLALGVAVAGGTAYAANTVFSEDIVNGEVKTPTWPPTRSPPPRSRTARFAALTCATAR